MAVDIKHVLIPGIGCEAFTDEVLAQMVAQGKPVDMQPVRSELFANGEWRIQVGSNTGSRRSLIRNQHVYIFASGAGVQQYGINDIIVHTLGMLDACQRADAKSITLIWLLFPYARSDKKTVSREPVMASMLTGLLDQFDKLRRIVTMDIHSGQIQGFTSRKAFTNLFGNPCLREAIIHCLTTEYPEEAVVLVSPDTGSLRRIRDYLKELSGLARTTPSSSILSLSAPMCSVTISKTRSYTQNNVVEQSTLSDAEKELVRGKTAIIIDDMIDTAGTITSSTEVLRTAGAKRVIVVATHGILSDPAIDRLNNCDLITKVIVTNTVDQSAHLARCPKLTVVSAATLIARYITCVLDGISLATLYE